MVDRISLFSIQGVGPNRMSRGSAVRTTFHWFSFKLFALNAFAIYSKAWTNAQGVLYHFIIKGMEGKAIFKEDDDESRGRPLKGVSNKGKPGHLPWCCAYLR